MNVFKEYGENKEPLAQYYYADGQVLAKKMFGLHGRKSDSYLGNLQTKGGLLYYQQDALGNIMDVTARTGDMIQSYRYDVFGNLFTQMAAPYNTIGFTGKTYDAKASLMDFSARWYSPNVGRFTTADTFSGWMDQPQSLNRYSYVHNNPVNFIDPTGRFIQENERVCDCDGYVEPEPTPSPSPGTGGSGGGYDGGGYTGGGSSGGGSVYTPPTLTQEQIYAQRMYDFNLLAGDVSSSTTNTLLSNFSYAGYGFNTLVASNGVSNNQQEPLGAESPEVFKINMQLNQLKMDWEEAYNIAKNYTYGSEEWLIAKGMMERAAQQAKRLREDNFHLQGLLQSTDKVQTVQELSFRKYTLGREEDNPEVKITVRIDENNKVYYEMPCVNNCSFYEEVFVQTAYSRDFTNVSREIAKMITKYLPGGSILEEVIDQGETLPVGYTITMVTMINSSGLTYRIIIATDKSKVVKFRGWQRYY